MTTEWIDRRKLPLPDWRAELGTMSDDLVEMKNKGAPAKLCYETARAAIKKALMIIGEIENAPIRQERKKADHVQRKASGTDLAYGAVGPEGLYRCGA